MTSKKRDLVDAINEAYRVVCTAYSKLRAERDAALAELAAAKVEIKRLREILEFLPDDDAALDAKGRGEP